MKTTKLDVPEILQDTRPIESIVWEHGSPIRVGLDGVTRIVAYGEGGPTGIPWIAVFVGDEISTRVPASQVQINYDQRP